MLGLTIIECTMFASRYSLRDAHRVRQQYEQSIQEVRVKLDMLNAKHGLCCEIASQKSRVTSQIPLLKSSPQPHPYARIAVSDMSDQLNRYLQALLLYYSGSDATMQEAERVCSCYLLTRNPLISLPGVPAE